MISVRSACARPALRRILPNWWSIFRRLVSTGGDITTAAVTDIMTGDPKTIDADLLAADALSIMQRHEITILAVHDQTGALAGVLHLQDLLGKGEFRFLV